MMTTLTPGRPLLWLLAVFFLILWVAMGPAPAFSAVRVQPEPGEAKYADALARMAESYLADLENRFGVSLEGDLTIIPASSNKTFQEAQPDGAHVPDWAAGVAWPGLRLIVIKTRAAAPGTDPEQTLAHEIVHIVLGQHFAPNTPPAWLNEGLTMHIAGDWGIDRRVAMARAVVSDRILPLADLVHRFPQDRIGAETAYAQSYYFIAFLKDEFGPDVTGRLVRSLSLGATPEHALFQATGQWSNRLERRFHAWLRNRFSIYWILTGSGVLWPLAAFLLLGAWWLRRRAARRKLEAWEKEEEDGPQADIDRPGGPGRATGYFDSL